MIKKSLPIPIYRIAMLQAYLYEIFSTEKKCEKNFKYTEWYLKDNFTEEEIVAVIKLFKDKGVHCDCGILKKLDIREFVEDKINFHN